ncbi:MAG: hypothetical protein JNM94_10005 [Phycisphaerae bacterium]|nr:hypothetical protein [Phycisphaerae bacterium]
MTHAIAANSRPALRLLPLERDPIRGSERVVRERIRESAQQLVADALVTPFLAQLRESVGQFSGEKSVFKQTDAEKRLGPVIDSGIADSLVTRTKWPLVDKVEQSLLARAGLKPVGAPDLTRPTESTR